MRDGEAPNSAKSEASIVEESRTRIALARALAETCPRELGREIAVTGSAARGMADEFSDVEINVWGDTVPDERAWRKWLEGAGCAADCWRRE